MAHTAAAMAFPDPEDPDDPARRVARLSGAALTGRIRYGHVPLPATENLERRMRAHRYRIALIGQQVAELEAERRRLAEELIGFQKGMALLLDEEVERRAREQREAWSPVPIPGYRMWSIENGRLRGARMVWSGPRMVAMCVKGGSIEVPHTDASCPRPQCGIYAAKHPDLLLADMRGGFQGVLGLVELSGKVVEHDRGYRAQIATVVALGMVGGGKLLLADDSDTIAEVFAAPAETLRTWGRRLDRNPALAAITEYLVAREEAMRWT